MRGVAGHHRSARGMRADAVLNSVGLAQHHLHPAVVDAQRIGADLRHRGGDPLADRGAAGDELDRARRIDADPCAVHRPEPALLDKDTDPGADQFTGFAAAAQLGLQPIPADPRQCLVEQQRVVAGIVDDLCAERFERPMERHFRRRDQVAPPDLHGIEAEPVGDRVDQPLAHESTLEPARRAVGRGRRLVGQAKPADRSVGRDAVRSRDHAHGQLRDAGAVGAHIGALVEKELVLQGQHMPFGVNGGADMVALLARVVRRHQVLAPVLDPFDRPARARVLRGRRGHPRDRARRGCRSRRRCCLP